MDWSWCSTEDERVDPEIFHPSSYWASKASPMTARRQEKRMNCDTVTGDRLQVHAFAWQYHFFRLLSVEFGSLSWEIMDQELVAMTDATDKGAPLLENLTTSGSGERMCKRGARLWSGPDSVTTIYTVTRSFYYLCSGGRQDSEQYWSTGM